MDRREFLVGAVTTLAAGAAVRAAAHQGEHAGHAGHAAAGAAAPRDAKLDKVVETSLDCVKTGSACVRHCVDLLAQGDRSLEGCMRSVLDVVAVCDALAKVAGQTAAPTKSLRAYAAACAQYCRDCAEACREHAEHHVPCKACMESCNRCAEACEALA